MPSNEAEYRADDEIMTEAQKKFVEALKDCTDAVSAEDALSELFERKPVRSREKGE